MDWRRAKLILTAAFLLLDAFLVWRVAAEGRVAPSVAAGSEASVSAEDLAADGVLVTSGTPLTAEAPALPLLTVRLQTPDASRLVTSLFGHTQVVASSFPATGDPQAQIFASPDERLSVLRLGLVRFERLSPRAASGSPDAAVSRSAADAFVRRLGGLPPGGEFDYAGADATSGRYVVRYVEIYNGLPVFPGYLQVDLDRRGVESAQRFWLDVRPQGGEKQPTIAAAETLLRLADTLHASRAHPIRVVGVRLGYYSRNYEQAAREWQLVPAWRVRLDGGAVYVVNAYTGAVEE